ncbi:MAG: hypothetical protein U9N31_10400 [Candidatus Marinimicrobia bacterium]|nr:hypothetical protein [Candidatus Neomarinimicrobiota bacterium]
MRKLNFLPIIIFLINSLSIVHSQKNVGITVGYSISGENIGITHGYSISGKNIYLTDSYSPKKEELYKVNHCIDRLSTLTNIKSIFLTN